MDHEGLPARFGPTHDLTRREFAGATGLALLNVVVPDVSRFLPGPRDFSARVLKEERETLPAGGTRTDLVLELRFRGYNGQARGTMIRRSLPTGDVIEHDVEFSPPVPKGTGGVSRHWHSRLEFEHGPLRGDFREDTLTLTGTVDGVQLGPIRHRVLRPLVHPRAGWTSEQRLRWGLGLFRRYGMHLPRDLPGALQVLDAEQ
jgi:hypothetical protein